MSKIFFFRLLPDDYHGAPEVHSVSPSGPVPDPPDYDAVFAAWKRAGYNTYKMGEGDTEEQSFREYGNADFYYAVYMGISDEEDFIRKNDYEMLDILGEETGFYNGGPSGTPEKVCEILRNRFPQIQVLVPLKKLN
jgi:hypothetical protein